ncbi:hypothetical protein ScPMuIL_011394 [Solemya velum]
MNYSRPETIDPEIVGLSPSLPPQSLWISAVVGYVRTTVVGKITQNIDEKVENMNYSRPETIDPEIVGLRPSLPPQSLWISAVVGYVRTTVVGKITQNIDEKVENMNYSRPETIDPEIVGLRPSLPPQSLWISAVVGYVRTTVVGKITQNIDEKVENMNYSRPETIDPEIVGLRPPSLLSHCGFLQWWVVGYVRTTVVGKITQNIDEKVENMNYSRPETIDPEIVGLRPSLPPQSLWISAVVGYVRTTVVGKITQNIDEKVENMNYSRPETIDPEIVGLSPSLPPQSLWISAVVGYVRTTVVGKITQNIDEKVENMNYSRPETIDPEIVGLSPPSLLSHCGFLQWWVVGYVRTTVVGKITQNIDEKVENMNYSRPETIDPEIVGALPPSSVIVDFCSGGGHLGIITAYLLPRCHVYLIENKEESLMRAKCRVDKLKLTNVTLYQSNQDYFDGKFDIGIGLHACGVATDMVLQQCIQNRASFVICPCCYGGVQNTHLMSYPRSLLFQNSKIEYKEFKTLGHVADMTEVNTAVEEEGKYCMNLVDTDRLSLAKENGYTVRLTSLQPLSCTPKNNLLIGTRDSRI